MATDLVSAIPSNENAEILLRQTMRNWGDEVDRLQLFIGETRPRSCRGCRVPDARVTINGRVELHESKVGFTRSPVAFGQFKKDVALVLDGQADKIVWHFFASEGSGMVGPSRYLLGRMEGHLAEIKETLGRTVDFEIVVHLPN